MLRSMTTIAALGLCAGVASAEFVGIDIREDKGLDPSTVTGVPNDTRTFNLYVVFDGGVNDDVRNTVLSTGLNDISIDQDLNPGATFFQETMFGGDTAPSAAIVGAFSEVAFDSFVTIGKKREGDPNPDGSTGDNTSPDPDFGAGGFTPTGLTGGWFNANPPSLQGAPEFNSDTGQYETILAQLSISGLAPGAQIGQGRGFAPPGTGEFPIFIFETDLFTEGSTMSIFRQGAGPDEGGAVQFDVNFVPIPGPGAFALFGVAGLAATRRRR